MGRRNALTSLTGAGEGEKRPASEVARDIDWAKVRRVQHGLARLPGTHAGSSGGFLSDQEMEKAQARSRRAVRLADVVAFPTGVLIGISILRGFSADPALLAGASLVAIAGVVAGCWALSRPRT